ncbi:L-2,4-diaminobutyric acid acetyltransferase [Aliiroseovarius sp. xm-m-379]|uniref:diaminobutyrate acetyltransferase n=1 Tax=unclassified Aliiroseovarius TaxID=2623558 RepID=UPI001569E59C|nr:MULTISPECIES: diaminobutyrate acetyltransferase [unclassified Aliiroseovarius]NRP12529.1 L-2,4-diaminobutyric acid acetyltransferase [Aliiroseovarius sp. xm-d-517]NRP24903.1 L-2,4-diaminobutyric acid acetyltransferase [Aliiroseovarius sp. xm-m-379]NRP30461.1 L-2,4-diaminobutyric acid acetyltransferase [Aliiroseovarius sp. xm-m-314]NRP33702.1 L-2,4-diaminobutyric acid acetyltransferase [Aliiroseovarius sp. xm-a-104]NRP40809.1 L-2,4-diaminobutyric acid acetyltransferase [Aliiroseovarius sp. x
MQHPAHPMRVDLPSLRKPTAEDGADIWKLVRACRPLDENSMYCNLLQCDHFADTCVLADLSGEVAGWVSAYVMPNEPDTLFVWQVAVSETARGRGLSGLMLQSILNRPQCKDVTRLQTTITADNEASWALFRKFASLQGSELDIVPYYTQALHFRERHKTEHMVTIPLADRAQLAA